MVHSKDLYRSAASMSSLPAATAALTALCSKSVSFSARMLTAFTLVPAKVTSEVEVDTGILPAAPSLFVEGHSQEGSVTAGLTGSTFPACMGLTASNIADSPATVSINAKATSTLEGVLPPEPTALMDLSTVLGEVDEAVALSIQSTMTGMSNHTKGTWKVELHLVFYQ